MQARCTCGEITEVPSGCSPLIETVYDAETQTSTSKRVWLCSDCITKLEKLLRGDENESI